MENDKVIILSLIDPFGEKPYLAEKSHEELLDIFDKLNTSLYEFSHKDYAPSKVLQSLAKKFRDVSAKEQELSRREEAIKRKESEYGIRSQLRTREISEQPQMKRTPMSAKASEQRTKHDVVEQKVRSIDRYSERYKQQAAEKEVVRPPDLVKRTRLVEDEEDPELEYAMKLSSDVFYGNPDHDIKCAISKSMEDTRREEDESYKQQEMRKAREEIYMKKQSEMQDEMDDAFATSSKHQAAVEEIDDEEINIDISKFSDRPPEVTPEILKDICVLLKKQDFDGARKIIGTLTATGSSWIVRLKCEKGTLKAKIVSRDVEAYKCILCRK